MSGGGEVFPEGTVKVSLEIPETLPLLPVRDMVVFPYMVAPLLVSRPLSIAAIDQALARPGRFIALVAQRNPEEDAPGAADVHAIGTVGMIVRMRKLSDGRIRVTVQGLQRARITEVRREGEGLIALAERLTDATEPAGPDGEALMRAVKEDLQRFADRSNVLQPELMPVLQSVEEPGRLADLVAAHLTFKVVDGQPALEAPTPLDRLRIVGVLLRRELDVLDVQATIQSRAKEQMSRTQREYFLREQLRQIQTELGEDHGRRAELEQLRGRIVDARMSDEARVEAERQLRRLEQLTADASEAGVARAYLDWLLEVPWSATTEDSLDLRRAQQVLNEDHHGLEEVKDRIVEHLGVLRLRKRRQQESVRGSILCFVGPPGVGKTSLGRSIARALGRKFVRMSLGGIRDEGEIRGHRRTYVGAMPGRILQGMRQAGTRNPVFILDEIDKLSSSFAGEPGAALLEVLDPEQNAQFRDHYLSVGYDLSRVLFIATANTTDSIPKALADRMEIIRLSGYSEEEKRVIAEKHILPRQISLAGLLPAQIQFEPAALKSLIEDYTREAGLRDLERCVAQVCRKIARLTVEAQENGSRQSRLTIRARQLGKYLGPALHRLDTVGESAVGACRGLAWTAYGGEVLDVEAQWMPGKGTLTLTGQLGDVMKESALTALSFARARAEALGLQSNFFGDREVHIHVPQGAIPKDGPSAGVTMACALVSLFTGIPVRAAIAMTGEVTLRGRILPVGGIREKLLAAARAGLETVLVPGANARDVAEIPGNWLKGLRIVFVDNMDQLLRHALTSRTPLERRARSRSSVSELASS